MDSYWGSGTEAELAWRREQLGALRRRTPPGQRRPWRLRRR
ncbi:hypothetical protein [Klenkia terrae]|uniref:Uncharacterized protein n=1 Tax=Klenkia terrae TaxID=1052259 RepID=A0ABU8E057_9ACTN|nr:hypothetical protein [Klenkia terrae]